jgi:hypothetical protein
LEMGVLLYLPKMAWMSFYASCSSWEDRCALLCPFFFFFFLLRWVSYELFFSWATLKLWSSFPCSLG